ncbi:MAG: PH domain-containing protein [Methylacidiphilales bacterium]|nr:PH domain-containing protein [Candidatus Methylacidiphilales bacterium]MDW8350196.1 PH domain-containing protein [Verrucomicrobiae bacterium]
MHSDETGSPGQVEASFVSEPRSVVSEAGGERTVWHGHPSHLINARYHALTLGLFAVVPPLLKGVFDLLQWQEKTEWYWLILSPILLPVLFYSMWKVIEVQCHHYILTTERLRQVRGVFTKRTEEVELYRVRDTELIEPLLMRFIGAGDVIVISGDATAPRFVVRGIRDAQHFRELLRAQVEACRRQKGVREWQVG